MLGVKNSSAIVPGRILTLRLTLTVTRKYIVPFGFVLSLSKLNFKASRSLGILDYGRIDFSTSRNLSRIQIGSKLEES
jgi:hypothetical protein